MRSLRLRFFLISWPLVVVAIAIVALCIDRWTVVELERVEAGTHAEPVASEHAAWAAQIGAVWPAVSSESLVRLAALAPSPVELVVLSSDGTRIAATGDTIEAVPPRIGGNGPTHLRRRLEREGRTSVEEFTLSGTPVHDPAGVAVGRLFVIPAPHEPAAPEAAGWQARLRRTLWIAAMAASLAAAAAAFLLAGPLVRQVRRLTDASAAIGAGAFDARVEAAGGDELAQLARSFNDMAQTLERAEAHKRNVVTDVAHELRTPLTNIIGTIESIQDGLRPADASTLASLRDEAGLLAALVDELQELSLAESGQIGYQFEAVDAVAASRAAVDALRASAREVTLRGPEASGPIPARTDARRLAQILRNLLRNAIAHTPPGGSVTIAVEAGARVTIAVTDTGRGIPAEHLPLIWERFHRVDPSRDRASGGMGIGLTLVRRLVEGMGGRVSAASELGRGSRFEVELPSA